MTLASRSARVVVARSAAQWADAAEMVYEYLAATQVEAGWPAPASAADLPAVLRAEHADLPAVYRAPGALLLAYQGPVPAGCVGLHALVDGVAEVKRLYVRPAHRRAGTARLLMDRAHARAASSGFGRLVLDVLPSRAHVIAFYRRLGYADAEPYAAESPVPMVYLGRAISP